MDENQVNEELIESIESAISEETLSDIDYEYYIECIKEQIEDLMGTNLKKNYLKKFEENLSKVCEEYKNGDSYLEPVEGIRNHVYETIIDMITEKFDFNVDVDNAPYSLHSMAKYMYKFFVLEYIDNVSQFLEMYIIDNEDDVIALLNKENEEDKSVSMRKIDDLPQNASMIINNLSLIISNLAGQNISFEEFVEYINMHDDSSAAANQMIMYDSEIFGNSDNIVYYILKSLKNEDEGFSSIFTNITKYIYQRYSE